MEARASDGEAGLILPLVLGAALAGSEPTETPVAYMERLYASYADSTFNPLTHPDLHFTPRLAAAINEDSRLANGEVGYLDGDPICQCQDPDGLTAKVTDVTEKGSEKAEVRVSLGLAGYEARSATFTLVRTSAGWRIDDVSSPDEGSLLHSIEESNRKQRSRH